MQAFTAQIKKVEDKDGCYVEIPFDVEAVFGSKRVKVKATFDGVDYRGSIVRMGLECHMIGITKEIRQKIGKGPGDQVVVTVIKDEEERIVELPIELAKALEADYEMNEFWNRLSFSVKRKYVQSITSAKKEETRLKRIETAIEKLKNKEKM